MGALTPGLAHGDPLLGPPVSRVFFGPLVTESVMQNFLTPVP
jgi:hypothetical protein